LRDGSLPDDNKAVKRTSCQSSFFTIVNGILEPKHDHHMILEESHSGLMAGHFAGEKLYKLLVTHWWWQGMYSDVMAHCTSCSQCVIVNAKGCVNKPPLQCHSIVGVDFMDY